MNGKLLFLLIVIAKYTSAQVFIERAPIGAAAAGEYNIYGTSTLSGAIPYNRIKGSPYWKDDWQLASLYSGKRLTWIMPVRLNLATHELHYLLNDREFVATNDNSITTVILHHGNDTSTIETKFLKDLPDLFWNKQALTGFVQVLNAGKYQLLKYIDRSVGSADSLFRTQKRYFFTDNIRYFIRTDEMIRPVKKLNEESFLSLLPVSSVHKAWIKENRLSFGKEQDLLKFLAHYNTEPADAAK